MKLKVFRSEVQNFSVRRENWVNPELLPLRLSVCFLPAFWFTIPSPVLPFTLVCLLDVTLSCSFLSLWTAFLTPPQSHVARTDPSPSLSPGHRSHFPLRSIRLHFRNYSRHSWGRKREEGEARKKGALRPKQLLFPWFLPVSVFKSFPTVVPSLPSYFLSFLPPSWSLYPLPGKGCVLSPQTLKQQAD